MSRKPDTLDSRPVFGDEGMVDTPLPRLNPYAREVVRSILEPLHVPYSVSAGEHSVTIISPMAWLSVLGWFGRFFKRPLVPLSGRLSVDGSRAEELSFTVSRGADYLRIRVAGDGAQVLGDFGRAAGAIRRLDPETASASGATMAWDTGKRIDITGMGEAYAGIDPEYNDQASPRL